MSPTSACAFRPCASYSRNMTVMCSSLRLNGQRSRFRFSEICELHCRTFTSIASNGISVIARAHIGRSFCASVISTTSHSHCNKHVRTYTLPATRLGGQKHEVRVRFAPSPTGFLHLGGLRTALYNFLFARQQGGTFILRLEDTDQSRLVPGAAQDIHHMLEWAGVPPDESVCRGGQYGPYVQSQRLHFYSAAATTLLESGHAYHCFCTNQRLELLKRDALRNGQTPRYDNRCRQLSSAQVQEKLSAAAPHVIRFRLSPNSEAFEDMVFGWTRHDVGEVEGDPVIIKADGFPTYHLASVVDDTRMHVSHVLRGSEWLISTCKHLQLYRALGETPPTYAHLPLLLNRDGSKLSKRQGDIYIQQFKHKGALPEALIDLITHCGSGFNSNNHLGRRLDDLISEFNVSKITTHSALLDLDKLPEFNRIHLQRRIEDESLCCHLVNELKDDITHTYGSLLRDQGVLEPSYIQRVLHLRKGHITSLKDLLTPMYSYLWLRPSVSQQQLEEMSSEVQHILAHTIQVIQGCGNRYTEEFLTAELKLIVKKLKKTKYSSVMKILRLALSGEQQGPGVSEIMISLGKQEACCRLQRVLQH